MGEMPWGLDGYDVERLLGFGATGEVWRARERASGRLVAVKRLRLARAGGTGSAARDRLRREGALLAAFSHPHVVGLRTVIEAPEGAALVLELAGGGSLAGVLAARGRLEAGEVVTTAAPLAEALAAAHARGLLHGDVSPSNVLYASDGRPLLADLGVARLVGEPLGAVDGTAEYLDPAVAAGRPPTAASDVHALAAVCYHALAGTPPYAAATHAATPAAAATGRFPPLAPLAPLAPDAPAALVAAVEAGLAADPGQRPDAARFAATLYAACPPVAVRLTPVETVDPPSARSVRAETPLTTAETPLTRVETPLTAATAMTHAVWPPPAPGAHGRPTDSGGLARRVRGLLGRATGAASGGDPGGTRRRGHRRAVLGAFEREPGRAAVARRVGAARAGGGPGRLAGATGRPGRKAPDRVCPRRGGPTGGGVRRGLGAAQRRRPRPAPAPRPRPAGHRRSARPAGRSRAGSRWWTRCRRTT